MKKLLKFKAVTYFFFFGFAVVALHSCAVYVPYNYSPVTLPDIVKMSQDKVPARHIINEIKKSHTAYNIKASEYAKLQKEGVSDSVVNFMQDTHLNMVRHNQRAQDSYYWGPGYNPYWYGGLGYGWPYYGSGYWGWNSAPIFIYRGEGGYHGGGFHDGGFHHRGGRDVR